MKRSILSFALGVGLVSLLAFTADTYQPTKRTAEVEQLQGVFVYVDSKPVLEYEYLGTVSITLTLGSGQYSSIRDKLIKKVKDDYPQADGAIMHFTTGGKDRADAIKFK